jgi:hypothetical protein
MRIGIIISPGNIDKVAADCFCKNLFGMAGPLHFGVAPLLQHSSWLMVLKGS